MLVPAFQTVRNLWDGNSSNTVLIFIRSSLDHGVFLSLLAPILHLSIPLSLFLVSAHLGIGDGGGRGGGGCAHLRPPSGLSSGVGNDDGNGNWDGEAPAG